MAPLKHNFVSPGKGWERHSMHLLLFEKVQSFVNSWESELRIVKLKWNEIILHREIEDVHFACVAIWFVTVIDILWTQRINIILFCSKCLCCVCGWPINWKSSDKHVLRKLSLYLNKFAKENLNLFLAFSCDCDNLFSQQMIWVIQKQICHLLIHKMLIY